MTIEKLDEAQSTTISKLKNEHDNIDIRKKLPPEVRHIPRPREMAAGTFTRLITSTGIDHAKAMTGFSQSGRYGSYYSPTFDGVVVSKTDVRKIKHAIKKRLAALAAKPRRKSTKEKWNEKCDALGIHDTKGHVAKALRHGDIDELDAELAAFRTRYRHEFTDYEQQYQRMDWHEMKSMYGHDDAKQIMRAEALSSKKEQPIPETWEDYLGTYGLDSHTARQMATILKSPTQAHPIWFKRAEIALRRNNVPLDDISYSLISSLLR